MYQTTDIGTRTCRILPESVVWLYANNRVDEAERVIRKAAKLNNIAMPGSILAARSLEIIVPAAATKPTTKSSVGNGCIKLDNGVTWSQLERFRRAKEKAVSINRTRYTLLDVFRNFRLAMYTLCMSFLWFVTFLPCMKVKATTH